MSFPEPEPPKDLYKILSVDKNATDQEIRSAYRKLSLKYHPDKNPNGMEMFQQINKANEILGDSQKRKVYDRYGEEGLSLLENDMFYTPPEDENIIVKWGQFITVYFISLFLDHLTGYPFEWIIVSLLNILALRNIKQFKELNKKIFLGVFVIELIIYLIIPNLYLARIANIAMYTSYILYCNTHKTYWDLSFGLWIFMIFIDFYFDRIPIRLMFIASHIVVSSSIFIVMMVLYYTISIIPEGGTSKIVPILSYLLPNLLRDPISLLSIPVWCLIWCIDYILGISIEWLAAPILILSQFRNWNIYSSLLFILLNIVSYYLIPTSIAISFSNLFLYILSLLILRAASIGEGEGSDTALEGLKKIPPIYYVLLLFFIYSEYNLRYSPTSWEYPLYITFTYSISVTVLTILAEIAARLEPPSPQNTESPSQPQQQQQTDSKPEENQNPINQ